MTFLVVFVYITAAIALATGFTVIAIDMIKIIVDAINDIRERGGNK